MKHEICISENDFIEKFKFSKKFGQNFLIDKKIQERIYLSFRSCILSTNIQVIEIGPGIGALTKYLCKDFDVVAIEIDSNIVKYLRSLHLNNLKIIEGDCLEFDFNKIINKNGFLFSNTPYSITTQIITKFINEWNFISGLLLVQKEVATRITCLVNSKSYSAFSVFCQTYLESKILFDINQDAFIPSPNVVSTLIYIHKKNNNMLSFDKNLYMKFLQNCFKMRRKKILNNLKLFCNNELLNYLNQKFMLENKRAQELTTIEFIAIYEEYINWKK